MTTAGDAGRVETIRLPDGWSARVLTGARVGDADLPEPEAWRPFLAQLVTAPQTLPGYAVLKSSRGSEVFRATLTTGDRSIRVVAKQSRLKNLRRKLSAMCQGLRETRNFRKGARLLAAGIDTALPLALITRRGPRREAWLITEFLADVVDLDQVARDMIATLDPRARLRVKRKIIEAIVGLLAALERNGLTHRDFKASNLLLRHWNGQAGDVALCVVDLDGIHRVAWLTHRRRWRPVVRLVASLLECPAVTRTDLVRFLRSHLSSRGEQPGAWRSHFHRIAGESAAYLRRSQRRKVQKLDGR